MSEDIKVVTLLTRLYITERESYDFHDAARFVISSLDASLTLTQHRFSERRREIANG